MDVAPPPVSLLARKYQAPVSFVERLVHEETEAITAHARVKAFVPIFVTRRVEKRLSSYAADHREKATVN